MRKLIVLCVVLSMSLPALGDSATITDNGDGTSNLTLVYTYETAKINQTLLNAGEFQYVAKSFNNLFDGNGDLIPYDDLTNVQKRVLILRAVKKILLQWAWANRVNEALNAANEQVSNEDILIPAD